MLDVRYNDYLFILFYKTYVTETRAVAAQVTPANIVVTVVIVTFHVHDTVTLLGDHE